MNVFPLRWRLPFLLSLVFVGCQEKPAANGGKPGPDADAEAQIQANLARLAPEDRRLAEQQKYCPVMPESRLGEMGPPHKVAVKGTTVFVCCQNCVQPAQDEPDKTLAQLKELQQRATTTKAK
jgi:hypothetical protein